VVAYLRNYKIQTVKHSFGLIYRLATRGGTD